MADLDLNLDADRAYRKLTVYATLADRYLNADPAVRFEVVREVMAGIRCPHGYPDQGEGCEVCDGR